MQTFLPYPDLRASCVVLDDKRLGKQRVETFQILRALTWPRYAWKNHPAVRMWRGFVPGLVLYGLENCREWSRRGYADTVAPQLLAWSGGAEPAEPPLPPWFGLEPLHRSHRSALLRKDPDWYGPLFAALGEQDLPDDLPYLWPPDHFPRWPVRAGLQAQPVPVCRRSPYRSRQNCSGCPPRTPGRSGPRRRSPTAETPCWSRDLVAADRRPDCWPASRRAAGPCG